MILRVIGFIGAVGGVFGYLMPPNFEHQQLVAAIVGIALFLLYAGTEIYTFVTNRDFKCDPNDKTKINAEMERIISMEGRTTILSRDLSWATDDDMVKLLTDKAKNNELVIHMQAATPLSTALKKAGAKVVYYDATGFTPESRFTMMNTGKPHATIAIGFVREGKHVVRRYRNGEEAAFHLANDLLRALDVAVASKSHA